MPTRNIQRNGVHVNNGHPTSTLPEPIAQRVLGESVKVLTNGHAHDPNSEPNSEATLSSNPEPGPESPSPLWNVDRESLRDRFNQVLKEVCKKKPVLSEEKREKLREELKEHYGQFADAIRSLRPWFPIDVLPPLLQEYIVACSNSIHCHPDLLAVPLLAVAGSAIGRTGRRLRVKDGWLASSCLWTVCMTESSGGKTPALNAVQNFYNDEQEKLHKEWSEAKEEYEASKGKGKDDDGEKAEPPGPYPALLLTDSTIESLRVDLKNGAVLFARDELGGLCHQMGQYKSGNADRFDWCSFWSHSPVSIGRKMERVWVKDPFVSISGMMVPASARELNYRGQADDGFVHRMLLCRPEAVRPFASLEGIPDELTVKYKQAMTKLFDRPKVSGKSAAEKIASLWNELSFTPDALQLLLDWVNEDLYNRLTDDCPSWLTSKYRKLYENCVRVCLVLHELWRVAGPTMKELYGLDHVPTPDESSEISEYGPDDRVAIRPPDDYFPWVAPENPLVIDRRIVEGAIQIISYFKGHIGALQEALGDTTDDIDVLYHRMLKKGLVTIRQVMRSSKHKEKDMVLSIFQEWFQRGYGEVKEERENQTVFVFKKADDK
jgi:Protein of unknown function (DUF3987)